MKLEGTCLKKSSLVRIEKKKTKKKQFRYTSFFNLLFYIYREFECDNEFIFI